MIAVIDYGMGNLRSVSKALESLGAKVHVTSDPRIVEKSPKVVLPGVGAFAAAMRELQSRDLIGCIRQAVASGKPYLGICLGLQLLFDSGEEGKIKSSDPNTPGLSILPGMTREFPRSALKVPHMGWNQVHLCQPQCPLLSGIAEGSFFYFVHSFYADPQDRSVIALETDYGVPFAAMVWRDNLFATQFHPEKSQA
ncbi:MAG: imidazole glycerol phosphate synthase subunit HisH, partial [Candidatus Omnitrophica bacterium]|nr:imidazole glycerol phosphate synthase subunit HisH [Candidatus Omnitrophota bacterium]